MSFAGKRVLSLESRRAAETAELIRRNGGEPVIAPSMQEAPLSANAEAFQFAERLFAGAYDAVILLTGSGTRYLGTLLDAHYGDRRFAQALRTVAVIARGPKPVAVCREWNVPVAAVAPEPNTWREVVPIVRDRRERRIAVQLYGKPHPELVSELRNLGADVTTVPVYQWTLPDDTGPLRSAAGELAKGEIPVAVFTSSQQVVHLFDMAADLSATEQVRNGLRRAVVGSIGPTNTEMLLEYGVQPDLEPTHPKLGLLIRETAEQADAILARKELQNGSPAA